MMGGQGAAAEYVRPQIQASAPTRPNERERDAPPHMTQSGNEGSYGGAGGGGNSDRGPAQPVS
jgi:hypothetical protein